MSSKHRHTACQSTGAAVSVGPVMLHAPNASELESDGNSVSHTQLSKQTHVGPHCQLCWGRDTSVLTISPRCVKFRNTSQEVAASGPFND